MLLPFQMSSCSEHIEEWHGNVTAGCVLLSNNSIIPLQNYDSSSMQGVGVVVGTREDSVWVVSAKELGLYAYLDTLTSVSDVSSDESALCGIENTAAMLKSDRKSPAVNAIVSFPSPVKGWILPSIGEMRMLSANLGTIGKAMETIGGDAFLTTPPTLAPRRTDPRRRHKSCMPSASRSIQVMSPRFSKQNKRKCALF